MNRVAALRLEVLPITPEIAAVAQCAVRGKAHGEDVRSSPAANYTATQLKLAELVAQRHYSQALRVREQALRRHPHWKRSSCEAQLCCLEGRQALDQQQPKRAEAAVNRALALGGEALLVLAQLQLQLQQQQPQRALALLEHSFQAGELAPEQAGAYLKLLLLQGQESTVRRPAARAVATLSEPAPALGRRRCPGARSGGCRRSASRQPV